MFLSWRGTSRRHLNRPLPRMPVSLRHTRTPTQPGPLGNKKKIELQMQLIQQGKQSKTPTPVVASPIKFGSPGRAKSSKVWVAGLKSGELVAYVTDRYHPECPAFIKVGLDKLRDNPQLCEKDMVSKILHKKRTHNRLKPGL